MSDRDLLLLSGGIDSAALAAWQAPALALTIDYGQVCAGAEISASRRICAELGVQHQTVTVDASEVGAGLLSTGIDDVDHTGDEGSAEFWPFRNQLLITIAAAVAWRQQLTRILLGTVRSDAARHVDGTTEFVNAISAVCAMQEGRVGVVAPAAAMTSAELVRVSGSTLRLLGWTHSCHAGDVACGRCPGCAKRSDVFEILGHPR